MHTATLSYELETLEMLANTNILC